MHVSRRTRRVRTVVVGVAVGAMAVGLPFVVSDVSAASTTPKPTAGVIYLSTENISIEGKTPGHALITGAFADHGTDRNGVLYLTKGTITTNNAGLTARFNSPSFATTYRASCSFSGSATLPLPIVSGTGAYAGITGNLTVNLLFGAQGLVKHGKCEANAAPVADQLILTGSGKVAF